VYTRVENDVVEMSQFRVAGVIALGYCQPVHRARGWLCVRAERGVSISRSHAHPGIVLVIVSSLGT